MVTGVEIRVEFAEGDLQRLEAIGQSLGHSIAAEEESTREHLVGDTHGSGHRAELLAHEFGVRRSNISRR